MKRWKMWVGCAAIVLSAAAAMVSAQDAFKGELEGEFAFTADRAELAALSTSIDGVTESLEPEARDEWRAQLEELTRPAALIAFVQSEYGITAVDGDGAPLTGRVDSKGSEIPGWRLEQELIEGVLEQRLESEEISQVYRYTLSEDGQQLVLSATITARALPEVLEYSFTYQR